MSVIQKTKTQKQKSIN